MAESTLSREDAEEFRALMRDECNVELTLDEAFVRATQLVVLARMLHRPIPEDDGVQTSGHLPPTPA
jgi:hypothetical protein